MGFMLIALLCFALICACFFVSEDRFRMNLLEDKDLSGLKKMKISRLELNRYRKTVYAQHQPRRQKISLDAPVSKGTNLWASVEDEIEVVGYVGNFPHVIFTCPYSKDDVENLLSLVNGYNENGTQK